MFENVKEWLYPKKNNMMNDDLEFLDMDTCYECGDILIDIEMNKCLSCGEYFCDKHYSHVYAECDQCLRISENLTT